MIKALYSYGVSRFGFQEFEKLIEEELKNLVPLLNSTCDGTNIGICIFKQIQRNATQASLNYKYCHILKQDTDRDFNIFMDIQDFLDLRKPKHQVLVKFHDSPNPIAVPYKKTETLAIPWLEYWQSECPHSTVEWCTDIFHFTRVMGGFCGVINLSNLLNRLEVQGSYNLTILLVCLMTIPNCDLNPISRFAEPEKNEAFKSIVYEDVQRKMDKITVKEDHLLNSRTRNLFSLPAIQGTNSFSIVIN